MTERGRGKDEQYTNYFFTTALSIKDSLMTKQMKIMRRRRRRISSELSDMSPRRPKKLNWIIIIVVVVVVVVIIIIINLPQWGAADAEIKVPSGENTELKRSPFKAWSRSVYSHKCYAYRQGFLPCLFLPFRSIQLHFFQNLSWFLLGWLWLAHGSFVGTQNKISHPAGCRFPCWVPAE